MSKKKSETIVPAELPANESKGKKVLKVIFNTIINILIVAVLIVSLLIAVMALTSKANGISTIFGFSIQPIESDSMKGGSPDGYEGGDYEAGDLMIAKATNFDDNQDYDVGDIITFKTRDSKGNKVFVSHRIVKVSSVDGIKTYQTWGDNRAVSEVPDQMTESEYIDASDIASVLYTDDYHGSIIKGAGKILEFLQTQQGFFFAILLPMIIFFMYALIRVVISATNYKKSKAEEEKQKAVEEAVAAIKSENETKADETPADMTPEQMEQFKQFLAFQQAQKAQQSEAAPAETPAEAPAEEAPTDQPAEE